MQHPETTGRESMPRASLHKRKRRRVPIKGIVGVVFLFAMVAAIVYWGDLLKVTLAKSQELMVKRVKFEGVDRQEAEAMVEEMRDLLSKNIFQLDLEELANAIKRRFDVREISIKRNPEKRELVIRVRKRVPVAVVAGDKLYPVDEEGVVLHPKEGCEDMPVISGVNEVRVCEENLVLKEAVNVMKKFCQEVPGELGEISQIDCTGGEFTLCLVGGTQVRVGRGEYGVKFLRLARVLEDLKRRGMKASYIDLRFKDPVVKPIGEGFGVEGGMEGE